MHGMSVGELSRQTQVVAELRSFIPGWKNYFCPAEMQLTFQRLDGWIRHRLRALQLSQWRNARTIARELRAQGARRQFVLAAAKHVGAVVADVPAPGAPIGSSKPRLRSDQVPTLSA